MRDKRRLRTCFRLKENEEKWQLSLMREPVMQNPILKTENATQFIIE